MQILTPEVGEIEYKHKWKIPSWWLECTVTETHSNWNAQWAECTNGQFQKNPQIAPGSVELFFLFGESLVTKNSSRNVWPAPFTNRCTQSFCVEIWWSWLAYQKTRQVRWTEESRMLRVLRFPSQAAVVVTYFANWMHAKLRDGPTSVCWVLFGRKGFPVSDHRLAGSLCDTDRRECRHNAGKRVRIYLTDSLGRSLSVCRLCSVLNLHEAGERAWNQVWRLVSVVRFCAQRVWSEEKSRSSASVLCTHSVWYFDNHANF